MDVHLGAGQRNAGQGLTLILEIWGLKHGDEMPIQKSGLSATGTFLGGPDNSSVFSAHTISGQMFSG